MEFKDKIEKRYKPWVIFKDFESTLWSQRNTAIDQHDIFGVTDLELYSVTKNEAKTLLIAALQKDLCYRVKTLGKGVAKEIAEDYLNLHHLQADFYTNSPVPFSWDNDAWSYSPIVNGSTVDTGVVTREGRYLKSMLWVWSID